MASLATPAEFIKRFDVRMLGDLVGDAGVRVAHSELLDHPNLQLAIDDAWGEILAALLMSKRYSEADVAALGDESAAYLTRINCQIALGNLWERRGWTQDDSRAAGHAAAADRARKELDQLRTGQKVLNIEAAQDAGLPAIQQPSVSSVTRANLVVDEARRGFYPTRRYAS
jgi:hypothetical protein